MASSLLSALIVVTGVGCSSSPGDEVSDAGPGPGTAAPTATSPDGTIGTRPVEARPSPGCEAVTDPEAPSPVEHRTIDVEGTERTYDVAYPTPPAAVDVPAPLVVSFHGYAGTAAQHQASTGIAEEGTADGAVVVVPDGAGMPATWEFTGTGADAAFVEAIVDEVTATACIDLDQVAMTGFSAGAAFAIAYSCAHPDQVAAIAAVTVEFVLGCTEPTSIIAIHGTADTAVPYQDGAMGASLPGVAVRGTELNMADWATLGDCGDPHTTSVADHVTHQVFAGCAAGTEVELFTIDEGPHAWPRATAAGDGAPATTFDATAEILTFLARQHR